MYVFRVCPFIYTWRGEKFLTRLLFLLLSQSMEKSPINVLSLFDGISCGRLALQRAGIPVNQYFASEIDKHAIKVTQINFPDTIQLGDVTKWRDWDINWPSIDFLFAGFPCQAWSFAGMQKGLSDPRGQLALCLSEIFEFVRQKNPKLTFLFENVKMKKEHLKFLNQLFGVEPIKINSALVSAQNRERLYWTNISDVTQPLDKNILISDILESDNLEKWKVKRTPSREIMWGHGTCGKCPNLSRKKKSWALTTKQDRWNNAGLVEFEDFCRYITPVEAERLQTVPDNYTSCISDSKRYHALGNGWTVDVIAHILKNAEF